MATSRQRQDYVESVNSPERVRTKVASGIADHRALLARMLAKGGRDAEAIDATIRGLADLRNWQGRLQTKEVA